jgi:glycosyltransferase involved in cell wall biosynthesis
MTNFKRKRIVHITFNMEIGGAEQVIYNLIEHTDPSKYEVSILCLEQPVGAFGKQLQAKGYEVTAFSRNPGLDFSLIKSIREHIRLHKIDVLHCHQYTPYFYGLMGAFLTRCRVIFTEHGRFYPDIRKLKRVLINPVLSLFTDEITAISAATGDALVRFENFPKDKIKVVYNGIDDSRYLIQQDQNIKKSLGISEKSYILGTVARLDSIKNQKMMIRSLNIVRHKYPEIFLIIVGDGPERKNLEQFTEELGLSSHVIFTGFREDTHRFYKIMNMFLLTSFSEGTAMTLLEAMATGLPCIATDVGGNPEIVKDDETGFLIPSDNETVLAEKIIALLTDENMIKRMGKAGRRRFEENFTVEKMVCSYQSMYEGKN